MGRFEEYEALIALVRHGSIRAAARETGVNRSTLARQVRRLEGRLQEAMLAQRQGVLRPTDAAARFAEEVERLIRDSARLEHDVVRSDRDVFAIRARWFGIGLTRGLGELAASAPDLRLEVLGVDTEHRRPPDLVICEAGEHDADRVRGPLGTVRWGWFASPCYLRVHPAPKEPEDLARHRLLLTDGMKVSAAGVTLPTPILRSASARVVAEAARAGSGVAWLPVLAPPNGLLRVMPEVDVPGDEIVAGYLSGQRRDPRLRRVLAFLRDWIAKVPPAYGSEPTPESVEGPEELLAVVRRALRLEHYGDADRWLDALVECLDAQHRSAQDPDRVLAWLLRSDVLHATGRFQEARELVERAVHVADGVVRARALLARLRLSTSREARDVLDARGRAVLEAGRREGLDDVEVEAQVLLGMHAINAGELDGAATLLESAQSRARAGGWVRVDAVASMHLALVALHRGARDDADRWCAAAAGLLGQAPSPRLAGELDLLRGELAKFHGDLDSAECHYRRAWLGLTRLGHANAVLARLNLGLVLAEMGRIDDAAAHLAAAQSRAEGHFHRFGCHLGMMVCVATTGEPGWEEHFGQAAGWAEQGWVDADFARLAELAGDRAAAVGSDDRAGEAWRLAAGLWERLDQGERAFALLEREARARADP